MTWSLTSRKQENNHCFRRNFEHDFTSQTLMRYNSLFSQLSRQNQAFQSQNKAKALTPCKNAHSQKFFHAERFVSLVEDLKSYFPGFFLNTKTMKDQNEISDTPVENEEATYNTLEVSVDKEQPSRKSKGLFKEMDKRRRTSSSSGDESSKSDSNGEGDSSSLSSSNKNPKCKTSGHSPKHVGDAD